MMFLKKTVPPSLRAFPRSVLVLGRGDTPLHQAADIGRAEVVELLLAANAPVDVQNERGQGPQFGRDLFGSFLARYCLKIGIHRSFQQKSHLLRQVSTSSVSRSEFFDLKSLNNLVSLLLILSKQNALKTYGVSHNLGGANLLNYTVFIFFRHAFDRSPAIFLPGRWSSNTFEIGFESVCSTTSIGVTQGIRYNYRCIYTVLVPFRNKCTTCTLPRLIRNLFHELGVFSRMSMTNLT